MFRRILEAICREIPEPKPAPFLSFPFGGFGAAIDRNGQVTMFACVVVAFNSGDAHAEACNTCYERYPLIDGWRDHRVSLVSPKQDQIDRIRGIRHA